LKSLPWSVIFLILGCFALVVVLLQIIGVAPGEAVQAMVRGSLGTARGWSGTLREMTPLLFAGLAVYVGLRAGLFNIGAEGQFVVGACASAVVAIHVPGVLGWILSGIAGLIAGALWAFPAGWIKAYRGGHEVVSTIMLNFMALQLTSYLVLGPIRDPSKDDATTPDVLSPMRPLLETQFDGSSFRLHAAWLIGILLILGFGWWLKKTVQGYELNATGANPKAAQMAGVPVPKVTLLAMCASGAFAGLGGAFHVLAYEQRFYNDFSPGYGYNALGVALLAGGSPWALIPAALIFGILGQSASSLQIMEVPKGMTSILLGLLIIGFAVFRYRNREVNRG